MVSGAGWKAGSVKGSSSSWSYSFTWSGALDNTVQATPQLTFRIDRPSGKRDPVPLTAYATATGTAGIATNGNTAHTAKATGYPAIPINPPNSGGAMP